MALSNYAYIISQMLKYILLRIRQHHLQVGGKKCYLDFSSTGTAVAVGVLEEKELS